MKIYESKIQCKKCKQIIKSENVHELIICKCGLVGVDGGLEYRRRMEKKGNYIELSKYEEK